LIPQAASTARAYCAFVQYRLREIAVTQPKLLDQYRERLRIKHYSLRTEQAYLHWVRRFIYFHSKRHPAGLGGPEVERFLSHLATEGRVSASTQNQALAALLFLYREVLGKELPWMDGVVRAKRPARVPVVLSENEVRALLAQLDGKRWLMAALLYATGMRLLEGLRLRVKDVGFERREITVRDGKGARDRRTMLPERLIEPLRSHLARVKLLHERDLAEGFGEVYLPFALSRKYPRGRTKLGLAIRVSIGQPVDRSTRRDGAAAPSGRESSPARRAGGSAQGRARQARVAACPAAQLRHAPARERLRHPDRPGAARPQGRFDDDGLHARS
jgi:integrase